MRPVVLEEVADGGADPVRYAEKITRISGDLSSSIKQCVIPASAPNREALRRARRLSHSVIAVSFGDQPRLAAGGAFTRSAG
jgi:hypothetical protein